MKFIAAAAIVVLGATSILPLGDYAKGSSEESIIKAGRTNVHSGGRTGGTANKRHGGQGRNHPNSYGPGVLPCELSGASTGCTYRI